MKTKLKLILANVLIAIPAFVVMCYRIYITLFNRG